MRMPPMANYQGIPKFKAPIFDGEPSEYQKFKLHTMTTEIYLRNIYRYCWKWVWMADLLPSFQTTWEPALMTSRRHECGNFLTRDWMAETLKTHSQSTFSKVHFQSRMCNLPIWIWTDLYHLDYNEFKTGLRMPLSSQVAEINDFKTFWQEETD